MNTMATIRAIYRYPVKGLSPELMAAASLSPGETLPGDRCYAIENGPSGFDPATPQYLPKPRFLMLMRNERLARLDTHFDDTEQALVLWENGAEITRGDLRTPAGRVAIEGFFARLCADELRGSPKVLAAPGHSFSDVARKVVSIINLQSLAAIENMVGFPINPLRFRANLYLEGWPAWREAELVGETLMIGDARLKVVKRITRCAAVNVDPDTAARDLEIPEALMRRFGHNECGIYAEVVAGGEIAVGDKIAVEAPRLPGS